MSNLRVISASQVETFRTCSLKWWFRHVAKELEQTRAAPLVIGSVVDAAIKAGIYAVREGKWMLHSHFYYFRRLGPWERGDEIDDRVLSEGVFVPGRQRPILPTRLDRTNLLHYVESLNDLAEYRMAIVEVRSGA